MSEVSADGPSLEGQQKQPATVPQLTSLDDLIIVHSLDPITNELKINFLFIAENEEVYYGRTSKAPEDMTLSDFAEALERIADDELFPELPKDTPLTIAPREIEGKVFYKRPGLLQYQPGQDTGTPGLVFSETLIMEQLSKDPHPNIVRYYGCRVRRGRIVAICIDKHEETLGQLALTEKFASIDHESLFKSVHSAVEHLHGMGLAHNDINPDNILLDNDQNPVLIDFGSCQPFGKRLQTLGTPGWTDGVFWTSEKQHDIFALNKLRDWLKDPHEAEELTEKLEIADNSASPARKWNFDR
ncbi:kinase-like domain-containing protein [Hypoxylon rubiginosum]|uniref:Kinase-like domain-containing protein n=1 Tax=Hypoxylon rubiginosum TaxID=110542 RepID=A0ACC0CJN9_9PEZI|nr:kinase-like domain-containing protein [Hypoxylon rubiginosum]